MAEPTHRALMNAPGEVLAFLEALTDQHVVITGVEEGCLAVEFTNSVPYEIWAEMTDIEEL